ncbi:TonB family protein [Mucilaginibacter sp. RB4R14]|uniref:energy transducer TonB n=1 Tax=Mucilaginibacter aurantiaciroseus TaxID=2949308 RepID=UPI0020911F44|nr:energy transducer TonB [Mucilaginibacter aurantiaciroseus]MCO5935210.1 TonB family protein [Mucilaginibacter aurantiaciroseus]
MLKTKLNLYNPDWIELVFAGRNKSYGAFELRQHYGSTMVKAMLIAFTTIITAAAAYTYVVGKTPGEIIRETIVVLPKLPPLVVNQPKKIEPPVKASPPAKSLQAAPTKQFLTMKVTNEPVITNPPKNVDLIGEIGPKTTTGTGTVTLIENPEPTTGGTGVAPAEDKTVHEPFGLEFMPEPVGGNAAWSKFLSKNLRFPSQAQEAGKGGRVIVSFVIEKDGHLSDITIFKGAGYGMDEEALRVLKLAKPWKPGMQNKLAVRVRYTIPLNFQLNEE